MVIVICRLHFLLADLLQVLGSSHWVSDEAVARPAASAAERCRTGKGRGEEGKSFCGRIKK